MTMNTDNIEFELHPNANKTTDMHPDLTGTFEFDDQTYEFTDWIRRTQDGERDYHSVSIYNAEARKDAFKSKQKIDPLARLKFYEFRKKLATDPDFSTTKEPLRIGAAVLYGNLWVTYNEDPDALEDMTFRVIF